MYNIRVHIAANSGIHDPTYLAPLITANAGAHPSGMSLLREQGMIGVCDQSADHPYAVGLSFCQHTFSLCRVHDAPGSENRYIDGCFDCACQVDRVTRRDMHRRLEWEHMRTENTSHGHSYIVYAPRSHHQTHNFKTLLRCQTCPGREFVCTEAHAKHMTAVDNCIYRFQRFLHKT